jgi:hypothetical protein
VSDEPRWGRRALPQYRAASGSNPAGEQKVKRFGWTFAPGDKVMQIENDYDKEVYNGESATSATSITVSFDGRAATYGLASLTSWFRPLRPPSTRARNLSFPQ